MHWKPSRGYHVGRIRGHNVLTHSRSFWVTGASNGLGLALVEHLLEQGHRVAASAKESDELNALTAQHGRRFLRLPWQLHADGQAADACQQICHAWCSLDGLILNANALPLLLKGESPQVMAVFNRYSALQLYAPTQVSAGWNNMPQWMREQRKTLKGQGIDVTVVSPQSLKTPVTPAQAIPEQWTPQRAAEELLRRWPQREPELVLETLDLSSLWPLPRS